MRAHYFGLLSACLLAVLSMQAPENANASLKKFLNESGEAISKGAKDVGHVVKEGVKDVGIAVKQGAEGGARAVRKAGSDADNAIKKAEDTCFSDRHARRCSH
jgi:hypothetical protein